MKFKNCFSLLGIILFVYILLKLNVSKVVKEILTANKYYFFIGIVFAILFLIFQTLKWLTIAYKQRIIIPFSDAIKINLMTHFYGFITPGRVGSIMRAKYLKKYTQTPGKGICNFTLDKILEISSVLFVAIISSLIFQDKFKIISLPFSIIAFIIIIAVTVIFIDKSRSKVLLRLVYLRLIPKRIKEKAKLTFHSFYENMPKKRNFVLFFLLNILTWLIGYTSAFFIGKSLGIELPFIYFLAILPLGTLVAFIPVTISGLGTRDLVLITLFGIFNIEATKIFSMSILTFTLTGIIPAFIGSLIILKRNLNN